VATDEANAAFASLALPLLDSLFNFACWLCHDRSEAEDLVQETFMKALKGFSSFHPGTNFRAWMFRILRNTFYTSRTGLERQSVVPLEEEQDEGAELAITTETPESILMASAEHEELQKALEELPLIYQEVVLLADVEEMSYQEIAEALNIPVGTVMSRLSRGRQRMRAHFQKGVGHGV
jgi:RNA polymerase sigma-70 factor (ECF subfamily)